MLKSTIDLKRQVKDANDEIKRYEKRFKEYEEWRKENEIQVEKRENDLNEKIK